MTKLIFLDIDGVLNCNATFEALKDPDSTGVLSVCRWENMIDEAFVSRLNKIIEATGAEIVISSSWRISNSLEDIRKYLKNKGCIGSVIETTGRNDEPSITDRRGREIQKYLDHAEGIGETIESFVILDDSADMGNLMPFLVRTNMETGLLDHHVVAANHILTFDGVGILK